MTSSNALLYKWLTVIINKSKHTNENKNKKSKVLTKCHWKTSRRNSFFSSSFSNENVKPSKYLLSHGYYLCFVVISRLCWQPLTLLTVCWYLANTGVISNGKNKCRYLGDTEYSRNYAMVAMGNMNLWCNNSNYTECTHSVSQSNYSAC